MTLTSLSYYDGSKAFLAKSQHVINVCIDLELLIIFDFPTFLGIFHSFHYLSWSFDFVELHKK
jgi:hypothetical protein